MESDLNFNIKMPSEEPKKFESISKNEPADNSSPTKDNKLPIEQPKPSPSSNYDLKYAAHPLACIFTVFFKAAAIASFLLMNFFLNDSILTFVVVVILNAFDFWTVKNITGRLLVGLRWWSDFKEDGTEVWIFESHDEQFEPNKVDSTFFWGFQFIASAAWLVFVVWDVVTLKFYWAIVSFIGLCLTIINLIGFYKCRGEHQKKMKDMQNYVVKQGLQAVGNAMMKNAMSGNKV